MQASLQYSNVLFKIMYEFVPSETDYWMVKKYFYSAGNFLSSPGSKWRGKDKFSFVKNAKFR